MFQSFVLIHLALVPEYIEVSYIFFDGKVILLCSLINKLFFHSFHVCVKLSDCALFNFHHRLNFGFLCLNRLISQIVSIFKLAKSREQLPTLERWAKRRLCFE